MNEPLVSVYLPTRNRVALLERALRSVFCQTYSLLEVIVVDDGSDDGTADLLAELRRRHSNLICHRHDSSLGASAARNRAIHLAKGEFVTGLDDDDEFLPQRIACFVRDWRARELRGELFSALYAQDVVKSGRRQWVTRKPPQVSSRDLWASNLINNQVFTRRVMLESIGSFDPALPMWQDLDCWIRLTSAFGPAKLTEAASYVFYTDAAPDRISSRGKERLWEAYERVLAKHTEQVDHSQRRSLFLQIYASQCAPSVGTKDFESFVKSFGFNIPGLAALLRAAIRHRVLMLHQMLRRAVHFSRTTAGRWHA